MTHRGRNSKQHRARYLARRIIFDAARYDHEQAECINKLSSVEVLGKVAILIPELLVGDIPQVEKGEVLTDSRGRGSFQR